MRLERLELVQVLPQVYYYRLLFMNPDPELIDYAGLGLLAGIDLIRLILGSVAPKPGHKSTPRSSAEYRVVLTGESGSFL